MRPVWGYSSSRGGDTPVVYALLAAMGIIFIFDWIMRGEISQWLVWPIAPAWISSLELWRPVTFPFTHESNFLYLITDALVLYFFGGSLERAWGSARFIIFFFLCGLVPGLVELGLSVRTGGTLFFGMVGGFVGMVVAFAAMQPYQTVLLLIFPLQARWLAVISVAYELFARTPVYGGPLPAILAVGATVAFAYFFTVTRFRLRLPSGSRGPTLRERIDRWKQRRRMREWQRRASRAQRPEDLFKDKRN
jgi:membrane associated rhomboid family serine protease